MACRATEVLLLQSARYHHSFLLGMGHPEEGNHTSNMKDPLTTTHFPQVKVSLCQSLGTPRNHGLTPQPRERCGSVIPEGLRRGSWGRGGPQPRKLRRLAGETIAAVARKGFRVLMKCSQLTGRVAQPLQGGLCTCQRSPAGQEELVSPLHTQLTRRPQRPRTAWLGASQPWKLLGLSR